MEYVFNRLYVFISWRHVSCVWNRNESGFKKLFSSLLHKFQILLMDCLLLLVYASISEVCDRCSKAAFTTFQEMVGSWHYSLLHYEHWFLSAYNLSTNHNIDELPSFWLPQKETRREFVDEWRTNRGKIDFWHDWRHSRRCY